VASNLYTIKTLNLSEGNDTVLTLYDTNGAAPLEENDDDLSNPPASKIDWLCSTTGTYFVKAAPSGPQIERCETYSITVTTLGDEYEPDDTDGTASPIAIDETQWHNFYPDGDVDKVTFEVKELDRLYVLGTSDLALGTDTVITVAINGTVCPTTDYYWCENDDISPGDLSSEVRFASDEEGIALATISKGMSGQYGTDKTYDLTLTLLPLGVDEYEPDEIRPKSISDRVPQEHNFYPDGDEDFVQFVDAKENRWYGLFTSDLAPRVDTNLEVMMDGVTIGENDDYDPGSGNFASTVCFTIATSGVPTVTITNLDQFGPTNSYTVTIVEEPFIETNPDPLTFYAQQGGPIPAPQTLDVIVPGGGNLRWQAQIIIIGDDDWGLDIGPDPFGKTPSTLHVVITGTTSLSLGVYQGKIHFWPQGSLCADSSYFQLPVNLVIAPASLSSPMLESEAWFIPGVTHPTPRLQTMYERTGIFLPLRWKEWDGPRRFRP